MHTPKGLHGVGISVVNALSQYVDITVDRGDKKYNMLFERGVPSTPLTIKDVLKKKGSKSKISKEKKGAPQQSLLDDEESVLNEKDNNDKLELVNVLKSKRKSGTSVTFLPDIKVGLLFFLC